MFSSIFPQIRIKRILTAALLLALFTAGLLVTNRVSAATPVSAGSYQQLISPQVVDNGADYYTRQEQAVLNVVTQGIWDAAQTSTLSEPVSVAAGALLPNTGLPSQPAGQIVVVPSNVNVAGLQPGVDYLRQELVILSFVTQSNWNVAGLPSLESATATPK